MILFRLLSTALCGTLAFAGKPPRTESVAHDPDVGLDMVFPFISLDKVSFRKLLTGASFVRLKLSKQEGTRSRLITLPPAMATS